MAAESDTIVSLDATRCFHCGDAVPAGADHPVTWQGRDRPTCCPGCQAVAGAIIDAGLGDYYRYRERFPDRAEPVPAGLREQLAAYDHPSLRSRFAATEGTEREAVLALENLVCGACVWLAESRMRGRPGILSFDVNYATRRAVVRWRDGVTGLAGILAALAEIGYRARPLDLNESDGTAAAERGALLRRLGVAGLGMMQVMMYAVALYTGALEGMDTEVRDFLRWVSLAVATPVVLYAAAPFFASAWRGVRNASPGMDLPVALAIGLAYGASAIATVRGTGEVYFDSVSMFTFFLLLARYMEAVARGRAAMAGERFAGLLPATARRLEPAGETSVPVVELVPGDRVVVRPGETIPADGTVVAGRGSVDESLLTGESRPLARESGDTVTGGTLNVASPLEVQVTRTGADTAVSGILRLVERARAVKPAAAAMADRLAARFVLAVVALTAAVFAWWWQARPEDALWIALSVLVVTCPCALSLATPAANTAALGVLLRRGLVVGHGGALETLSRVSHVVLDKTGTLTRGMPAVVATEVHDGLDAEHCRRLAAALEARSEHPLAAAFRAGPEGHGPAANELRTHPGEGVEGVVEGVRYRLGRRGFVTGDGAGKASGVWLGAGGRVLARFEVEDPLRPEAAGVVAALRRQGVTPVILSGDGEARVREVANRLGVVDAEGGLSSEDKLNRVRALQQGGAVVAMVGDGVNDAPVLAAADVSLAMARGTDLARHSADIALIGDGLVELPAAVATARRSRRVIGQNFGWALAYNTVALPLAAAGWVLPWMAAIGMSASSLVVVGNALRLSRSPGPGAKENV